MQILSGKNQNPQLPTLTIDDTYTIWLHNKNTKKEVVMTPLCKALYILFYQNPQGISLYDLHLHQSKLLEIYKHLSPHHNYAVMKLNIKRLVNKYDNSIHEKISRIKQVFLQLLPVEQAHFFYITGKRREVKSVGFRLQNTHLC